jgi:hypothetical protein
LHSLQHSLALIVCFERLLNMTHITSPHPQTSLRGTSHSPAPLPPLLPGVPGAASPGGGTGPHWSLMQETDEQHTHVTSYPHTQLIPSYSAHTLILSSYPRTQLIPSYSAHTLVLSSYPRTQLIPSYSAHTLILSCAGSGRVPYQSSSTCKCFLSCCLTGAGGYD